MSPLPEGVRRLFPDHGEQDLLGEEGRSLLCERLLEDGDSADLRWLVAEIGRSEIAEWFAVQGGRKLSRRSRAFWTLVLGHEGGTPNPVAEQLWPG